MADKPEVLATPEEKETQAKELFARGSRNYYTKQYAEAADDFSACCGLYSEVKAQFAEELGMPYLMYAKALMALGTEENKLLAPEDGEGEAEGEDESEEGDEENGEDGENGAEDGENGAEAEGEDAEMPEATNGHCEAEKPSSSEDAAATEPQPGPSTSTGAGAEEKEDIEAEDDKAGSNLQVAWEVLEIAVKIFQDQGEKTQDSLAEALGCLADISFENSHFEVAINDFQKALDVHGKMAKHDNRAVAEIHYKIGLAQLMLNNYEDSVLALKKAANIMDEEIELEKKKEETEETKATIKDLEETKQDILIKITEVEEAKTTSIEQIKNELSKIIGKPSEGESTSGSAGQSNGVSPPSADKKATDISHLIKRKKPDTQSAEVQGSPAKKTHVEGEQNGS